MNRLLSKSRSIAKIVLFSIFSEIIRKIFTNLSNQSKIRKNSNTVIPFLLSSFLFLTGCQNESSNNQSSMIKVAFDHEPSTLDPRLAIDLQTANVLQMIYEGLMRLDHKGQVTPGVAETVDVSPDSKTYTFNLRKTNWSDGTPLVAKDFEESWKSTLDPSFPAPNAYQLYYIKNAQLYKEGKIAWEEVGVKTQGDTKLIIELENSTPYFLKLAATYFYLPVCPNMRLKSSLEVVSNGPFKLKDWKHNDQMTLAKNLSYWDEKVVSVDEIALTFLDENTSYKLFEKGYLDRTGSPTATLPQDAVSALRHQQQLKIKPAAGTHWFRFNTDVPPFNNVKMRKAFNLALNRQAIVEHVTQGNQIAASGIVPPIVDWEKMTYYQDNDVTSAWQLFQEALIEMNLDKDSIPSITLLYTVSDRNHKISQAAQQQWNKAFGIQIKLQSYEPKIFSENVSNGNYQVATGSWYADFNDPINFLEIFKYKTNASNRTGWENQDYIQILDASSNENDPKKRFALLKEAEAILINYMPIAPLFFGSFNYLESDNVGGIALSELGILDFKYAFVDDVMQ